MNDGYEATERGKAWVEMIWHGWEAREKEERELLKDEADELERLADEELARMDLRREDEVGRRAFS